MTDSTPEDTTALTGPSPEDHAAVKAQIENILDLDAILSSARRVERTAFINTRADLEDRYNQVIDELAALVDEDGNIVSEGDSSLADGAKAEELREEADDLRAQMKAATKTVRFRAMDSDAWEAFESTHRHKGSREIKDERTYVNQIIADCAIAPTLTVDDVVKLRKQLGHPQITTLFNEAYWANTTGGLDVPKSPSFLHAPKPQE
jgi:hypothetical protein